MFISRSILKKWAQSCLLKVISLGPAIKGSLTRALIQFITQLEALSERQLKGAARITTQSLIIITHLQRRKRLKQHLWMEQDLTVTPEISTDIHKIQLRIIWSLLVLIRGVTRKLKSSARWLRNLPQGQQSATSKQMALCRLSSLWLSSHRLLNSSHSIRCSLLLLLQPKGRIL